MALINCPECSKEVSNTCRNCIHCGYSLQISSTIETPFNAENPKGFREVIKKRKIIFIFALSALALAVAIILIFSFSSIYFSVVSR